MESKYTPALWPLLRTARRVVVVSHLSPDGDAVAALVAMSVSLRLARVEVRAISPSPIPASYRFLPGWETISIFSLERLETPEGFDVRQALLAAEAIVCLDCSDLTRLGPLYTHNPGKFETATVINIDHHTSNSHYGTLNLVDPSAASVCELLAVLMEREDLPVTREIASALLVGIVSDTQGFRTAATSADTLRVAATLMERGASLSLASDRIFNTRSPRSLRLWGSVLSRIRVEDELVWADITGEMLEECGASLEDADRLVDFIAGVPDAVGTFLFSEEGGMVRVSIRTSGDLDAASLARTFGGGGHARAAGCTLAGTVSEVRALLMAEARRRLGMVATAGGRQQQVRA